MARHFEVSDPEQMIMLTTVYLGSVAPPNSVLYAIKHIVESLDTSFFEAGYDLETAQGKNPIHPKIIIKVCLYAIYQGRFSTRKMERDTGFDLGYKYLTGDRQIDHSTFSKFLSRFRLEIVELFAQIVEICQRNNLVKFKGLAIDSVKIRANASYKRQKSLSGIERSRQKLRKKIEGIINQAESEREERSKEEEQQLRRIEKRMKRMAEAEALLKERLARAQENKPLWQQEKIAETATINLTDSDAQIMEQRNGEKNPSYSITTATDTSTDVITHFQVNVKDDDRQALVPAIEGSSNNTGRGHEVNLADSGFHSFDNLEYLEKHNIRGLIPHPRAEVEKSGKTAKGDYDRSHFCYEVKEDRYRCPQGQVLPFVGEAILNGRRVKRYQAYSVCNGCAQRGLCAKGNCRTIYRDEKETYREAMQARMSKEENQSTYSLRAHASEAPYGCIKRNWKVINFMRRGVTKVKMECALAFSLHNLLKLIPVMATAP